MFPKLERELQFAKADFTKRLVACVLVDDQGNQYEGHNNEVDAHTIFHAETEAISKLSLGRKVSEMHLLGNQGTKAIIPCESCTKALFPLVDDGCKVSLYAADSPDKVYSFLFSDLIDSYASNNSVLLLDEVNFVEKLQTETPLSDRDISTLYSLRQKIQSAFVSNSPEVYLTGSAAGFSPRCLIVKQRIGKKYGDADLVFIFEKEYPLDLQQTLTVFYEEISQNSLGEVLSVSIEDLPPYTLEELDKDDIKDGFLWRKEFFVDGRDDILKLDISLGKKISSVMTRQYLSKNWLIKLL